MSDEIELITAKLVINSVTGTHGQSAFKEREIRQRLVPQLRKAAAAEERDRIAAVITADKIEWMIHAFDLIDNLMIQNGMDTASEVQDDLRTLAGMLEGKP